jgi:ABC-type transport system involved in multi-copper enzyme maturation permease subunit
MAMRWGLGPVFAFEWLMTSRRWQFYAARVLFLLVLLAGLFLIWQQETTVANRSAIQTQAQIGEGFFFAIVGIQLTLVMLAAPAATAGAICVDKVRGSLLQLMATDLSNAEIVLGKLASRLVAVLGLIGCTIPLLFLATFFGGIDPDALIGAFVVTTVVAILGCSFALTLSIWATKAHDVLMVTYLVWTVVVLGNTVWSSLVAFWAIPSPPVWFEHINPYWIAFGPYSGPGAIGLPEQLTYCAILLVMSVTIILLSTAFLRWVIIRQARRAERRHRRAWRVAERLSLARLLPGPSLDGHLLLWRERRCQRSSRWSRLVWCIYLAAAGLFTVMAVVQSVTSAPGWLRFMMAQLVNTTEVGLGFLLLSVTAVIPLGDDRMRGSIELLLVTPLSTPAIVRTKWLTGAWLVLPIAVFSVAVGLGIAVVTKRFDAVIALALLVLAYGAAFTSLGLALATWIRRYGRAMATSVAIYVLVNAVFSFCPPLLFPRLGQNWLDALMLGSPLAGIMRVTEEIASIYSRGQPRLESYCVEWAMVWTVIYGIVALALYAATLRTFNRCLGRMPTRDIGDAFLSFEDPDLEPLPIDREIWWKMPEDLTPLNADQRLSP